MWEGQDPEQRGAWKVMDDLSFTTFVIALDEYMHLFWRMVKLSCPGRSLIESFQRSGLLQQCENLGSVGRESVWAVVAGSPRNQFLRQWQGRP
jgi:hypothetical protein